MRKEWYARLYKAARSSLCKENIKLSEFDRMDGLRLLNVYGQLAL